MLQNITFLLLLLIHSLDVYLLNTLTYSGIYQPAIHLLYIYVYVANLKVISILYYWKLLESDCYNCLQQYPTSPDSGIR